MRGAEWVTICKEHNLDTLNKHFRSYPPRPTAEEKALCAKQRAARVAAMSAASGELGLPVAALGDATLHDICTECHNAPSERAWRMCRNPFADFRHGLERLSWNVEAFPVGRNVTFKPWVATTYGFYLAPDAVQGVITAYDVATGFYTIQVGKVAHEASLRHRKHAAVVNPPGARREVGVASSRRGTAAREKRCAPSARRPCSPA